ncbi:MAG: phosphoenolpyruvate--protein phosphotransferase [Candidatus Latescibacterota bacterium]
MAEETKYKSREYTGIPGSPGIAIGQVYIYDSEAIWIEERFISPDMLESEKARLKDALDQVISDIRDLKQKLEEKVGKESASIFDPYIMLLEDPHLIKETHRLIEEGKSAEYAFFRTTRKIIKAYKRTEDEYMRERIGDITDLLRRVYTKLLGKEHIGLAEIDHPVIVVAPNLTPSDTANMHSGKIQAFVTDYGGKTSHATILARALKIPAVLGVKTASHEMHSGDTVIVDGNRGKVYVNPDQGTIERYIREQGQLEKNRISLMRLRNAPAITTDGKQIKLLANIEFPEEAEASLENGAEGIGLYRSEFHYLMQDRLPTEEEMYTAYREVADKLHPRPVVVRTFDLGGDKVSYIAPPEPEENPYLGWRAIRVSLSMKDLFKIQLRAIYRASAAGNVRVMFPMISSLDELLETLDVISDVKRELEAEGRAFDPEMPIGVMIEVPAAVMIADKLAEKVNFFSIGTNDLIQYSVAVDRANDKISNLFEPFHPGILRLIRMTVESAHQRGISVAVCGEMGGDPAAALLLVGLGIDELSMTPSFIPAVKRFIRTISMEQARRIANQALECGTASEVREIIEHEIHTLSI